MKVVGLIAEYNPFHNGHQFHIEKAKQMTGADTVVVVMSGNYVQRGTPAIMPKHLRSEAALKAGASLVLELPVCYATGTAEQFALGAVSLLDKLGCIDALCFGSECGDISSLKELAAILINEPQAYKSALQDALRQGQSFPVSRQYALETVCPNKELNNLLAQPNNILGIEYLKALHRINSNILPYTTKRVSSNYHDTNLQENFSSASAIRTTLKNDSIVSLVNQVPDSSMRLMNESYQKRFPIYANDFSVLLKYQLLRETNISLSEYADVSEELANRIIKERNNYIDFDQFVVLLKTKEITYTRICRALLHILLGIKKTDYTGIAYARVLGFRKEHADIFKHIKEMSSIPLLTKLSASEMLSDDAKKMLETDMAASDLYESVITDKFKTKFINENEHQIVRV